MNQAVHLIAYESTKRQCQNHLDNREVSGSD
jgi:hypothetical protein